MNATRYRYEDVLLTQKEGREVKATAIEDARRTLAHRKEQVKAARLHLKVCKETRPPTHRKVQIEVNPGDVGYAELSAQFNNPRELYQGKWEWINHS